MAKLVQVVYYDLGMMENDESPKKVLKKENFNHHSPFQVLYVTDLAGSFSSPYDL